MRTRLFEKPSRACRPAGVGDLSPLDVVKFLASKDGRLPIEFSWLATSVVLDSEICRGTSLTINVGDGNEVVGWWRSLGSNRRIVNAFDVDKGFKDNADR